ncbi:MAG: carboxylating nicotinate-nucleotide diphosphorylase [Sedimenticolaceae bacterium]|nr:carboxylating nicotinate-nucleotide diphosphorylase [Sedimenticolaceae bacterium]
MAETFPLPPQEAIAHQVRTALEEDVGEGDLTAALLDEQQHATANVIAREDGILCGTAWFDEVFRQVDPHARIDWLRRDGDVITENGKLCAIHGPARSLLTAERTALNFLQTLSGTATLVNQYVNAVKGTGVRILDTRKTIPGMRLAQKYAVLCGGGANHRIGLYDAILIKENHIRSAGSITRVLQEAFERFPDVEIEIEVESAAELVEALDAGARRVLLDNFSMQELEQAVSLNQGRARLEVSGNVTLGNLRALAETGIDDISIGALTKHLRAFDFSMLFEDSYP